MTVPLPSEINVFDSLDERVACDNFAGKTLDEVAQLFAENPSRYLEDLMHMGPVAFRYYIRAATKQLLATKDQSLVREFVSVLEVRLECDRSELVPIVAHLREACEVVLANAEDFGICKTPKQIQADAESLGQIISTLSIREVLGADFEPARFVDLQARYSAVCDMLRQMEVGDC